MNNWSKRLFWIPVTLVVLSVVLPGCSPSGGGGDIKVGEYASLTGKEATFGTSSHEGTLLAVEQINASSGVLGKKMNLITEDDLSKAGEPACASRS